MKKFIAMVLVLFFCVASLNVFAKGGHGGVSHSRNSGSAGAVAALSNGSGGVSSDSTTVDPTVKGPEILKFLEVGGIWENGCTIAAELVKERSMFGSEYERKKVTWNDCVKHYNGNKPISIKRILIEVHINGNETATIYFTE